ncbi:MAG TPA: hypothetical protein VNJ04_08120 [Gemmatimonadaceae bacterium]|nr:hypothetical protein [Gemmatimonadaceae bacterium]
MTHLSLVSIARDGKIATPEGKPTHARQRCSVCGEPLPLQYWRETRTGGAVLVYPTLDSSVRLDYQGRASHGACAAEARA